MATTSATTLEQLHEEITEGCGKLFKARALTIIKDEFAKGGATMPSKASITTRFNRQNFIRGLARDALRREDDTTLRRLHECVQGRRKVNKSPNSNVAAPAATAPAPSTTRTPPELATFSGALAGTRKPTLVENALAHGGSAPYPPVQPQRPTLCPHNKANKLCHRQDCKHWHEDQIAYAKTQGSVDWNSKIDYKILCQFEKEQLNDKYKYSIVTWPPIQYTIDMPCRHEDQGKACREGNTCRARHERQIYFATTPGANHWKEKKARKGVVKAKRSFREGKAIRLSRKKGAKKPA
ncbi:Nn.00g107790.m01.CDS01 [Neocucurbitaria sp. VM-36]